MNKLFAVSSVIVKPSRSVADVAPDTDKIGLVPSVMMVVPVTVRVPLSEIFNGVIGEEISQCSPTELPEALEQTQGA